MGNNQSNQKEQMSQPKKTGPKWIGEITNEELQKHKTKYDCWVVFQGAVYDMTPYLTRHPGGVDCITTCAGGDMTEAYMDRHPYLNPQIIEGLKIGYLTQ